MVDVHRIGAGDARRHVADGHRPAIAAVQSDLVDGLAGAVGVVPDRAVRQRLQLADVDSVGRRRARGDIGDAALGARGTDRDLAGSGPRDGLADDRRVGGVAEVGRRGGVGAERQRVRRRRLGAGTDRDGVVAGRG